MKKERKALIVLNKKMVDLYDPHSILITGCAGFIGSALTCYLVQKYPSIRFVGLDLLLYSGNLKNLDAIHNAPNFDFVKGDITSSDLVNYLIKEHRIDTIMHLAAESSVDASFHNSAAFIHSNVLGTHALLEAARLFKEQIKRFVHTSTDEVWGSCGEDDPRCTYKTPFNPCNPYSASKAGGDCLVMAYSRSFQIPCVTVRPSNAMGERQHPEKFIPKCIHLLARKLPIPLHGTGLNRRSFLYVGDLVKAFELVLFRGRIGTIYPVSPRFDVTNKQVAEKLIDLFGGAADQIVYTVDRAFNDEKYHIDPTEIEELGWTAETSFDDALIRTKQWYLDNMDHWENTDHWLTAHPGALTPSPSQFLKS